MKTKEYKMNRQVRKHIISSAVLLGLMSATNIATAQSTTNANVETFEQNVTGSVQRIQYNNQEALTDPLRNATDIVANRIDGIPTPNVSVSDISYLSTVIIQKTRSNSLEKIDVSLLDDFITEVSPNARHYPPNFKNASQKYYTKEKLKELEAWIRPFAENSDATYDVLIRAAKLNGMARNLDLGSDYAVRASTYVAKAIDRQPDSAEANFLYGMMLSEGGGFKESKKYLNKAVSLGYKEAEQSLAQADLLNDNRSAALSRLQSLLEKDPNNKILAQQINLVQNGKYYIWDLPSN